MTFLSEILQFAVLIPAAILAILPLKNKLRFSVVKIAGLMALALGFLIPFCGWIVTITGIPVNYILFPVMAGTVSVLPQGVYGARKRGSAHISV